jgi:hypothetical protein
MLSESLRVPYRADDAFGTILVGSVLTFSTLVLLAVWTAVLVVSPVGGLAAIPVVALPSLVIRGYLLAVVDSGIHDRTTVPSFVRWGSLVRTGSSSTLLSAIYLLPAALLGGLAVGGWVAAAVDPPGFTETAQALVGVLLMVAGFGLLIYGLVYMYVRPAVRAVFASTGSLRAALRVRRVLRLASTGDYLTGWLIAMGLLTVGPTLLPLVGIAVAVGYLSPVAAFIIVLVTILLGVCLGFVVRVSAAWATGRGAATGLTGIDPASVRETTDEAGVLVDVESEPAPDPDPNPVEARPEADPTVQTGRTVSLRPAESQPAAQSDASVSANQSTPTGATAPEPIPTETDGNGSVSIDDSETVDNEGEEVQRADSTDTDTEIEEVESVDGDKAEDTDDEDGETVDIDGDKAEDADDTGFVWGVDDES